MIAASFATPTKRGKKTGLRLALHAGQREAWNSDARFTFVIAGTQSGKTSFGPYYMLRGIERSGPGDYLAVTSTYDLFKLKMLPETKWVFLAAGWAWQASERVLAKGESRVILRSAQSDGGLESATVKGAWLDECGQDEFRLEAWDAVQRRLSLNEGWVLGTTTPYNLGWLKTEVFDRWAAGDTDYRVVQFKSTQNPVFPLAEYERARRTLPAWKFEMFYNGQFTRPAGMIYGDFNADTDVIDDFPIPRAWPRIVGIDFGANNTALVWLAYDQLKDVWIAYREQHGGTKTTAEHAGEALELAKNENVIAWQGGAKSEVQQRLDWQAAGVDAREPVVFDVEAGIDRVIALIKTRRLKIFRSLRGLLDELGTYSRKLDTQGQPTEEIKDKEKFHRLDALRYGVQIIDSQPASAENLADLGQVENYRSNWS